MVREWLNCEHGSSPAASLAGFVAGGRPASPSTHAQHKAGARPVQLTRRTPSARRTRCLQRAEARVPVIFARPAQHPSSGCLDLPGRCGKHFGGRRPSRTQDERADRQQRAFVRHHPLRLLGRGPILQQRQGLLRTPAVGRRLLVAPTPASSCRRHCGPRRRGACPTSAGLGPTRARGGSPPVAPGYNGCKKKAGGRFKPNVAADGAPFSGGGAA